MGPFLSEAISEPIPKSKSSFNECLILATICGRSLLQRQQHHISKAYGDTAVNLVEQHRWLDDILVARLQVLAQCYPPPTESNDPLLVFANIFSQATVIHFCGMMADTTVNVGPAKASYLNNAAFMRCQSRALEASTNLIKLASTLRDLPTSRVHIHWLIDELMDLLITNSVLCRFILSRRFLSFSVPSSCTMKSAMRFFSVGCENFFTFLGI